MARDEGERVISARAAIQAAAPFIDAGHVTGWKPSELLTIGWGLLASTSHVDRLERADAYVSDMLDEARNRWAAGFFADPFTEPVRPRPASATSSQKEPRE